ncbi:MAG: hypothetical protein ABSH27_06405 [Solirubrobacteraceae bacterium]
MLVATGAAALARTRARRGFSVCAGVASDVALSPAFLVGRRMRLGFSLAAASAASAAAAAAAGWAEAPRPRRAGGFAAAGSCAGAGESVF